MTSRIEHDDCGRHLSRITRSVADLKKLTASIGAHDHYNRRRETGDRYYAALRNLFNRMLGQLHHCLTTRQRFDEAIAFTRPKPPPLATAA